MKYYNTQLLHLENKCKSLTAFILVLKQHILKCWLTLTYMKYPSKIWHDHTVFLFALYSSITFS